MTTKQLTYDDAINAVGFGNFQRKLMVICGLGWAADAMEILIIAFAIPAIALEWGITASQKGLLASAIFLGMLAGAWFWGGLADRIGRKVGFMATIGVDSIFGLLSALSPNFIVLLILRTITGFGVGGTLPVDYSMFAEYLPQEKRGRYLVLLESFWALGTIVVAGLAWLLVPTLGWRALLAVSAIPGLIILWIRRYIPESPRYLLVSGKPEEARAVLERVARENGTTLPEGELIVPPAQPRPQAAISSEGKLARTNSCCSGRSGFVSLATTRFHVAADLLPRAGHGDVAGLSEYLPAGAGPVAGLFLGGVAGRTLGPYPHHEPLPVG
ncbi:MAG: MFS transporter [Ardenticatenales bacterium]|nr:MFS transporter [Ardenticatenales bacterium]